MIKKNIAMLAAETSRSRFYLQSIAKKGLLPSKILILENRGKILAGQDLKNKTLEIKSFYIENFVFKPNETLEETCKKYNINFNFINETNVNLDNVIEKLKNLQEKIIIYSGYGGTILRSKILNIGKYFLHIHGGYLPDYRGSTTNYYSALKEKYIGASSIIMSEKIDTGPILYRKKFKLPPDLSKIDHIYDSSVRSNVLIKTLQMINEANLLEDLFLNQKVKVNDMNYFIIHPVLKHLSILNN